MNGTGRRRLASVRGNLDDMMRPIIKIFSACDKGVKSSPSQSDWLAIPSYFPYNPSMDSATLTLAGARRALDAREISSLELTDLFLERIARYDPKINSFITVTADHARSQAGLADSKGGSGRLHGIPISLKDLYDVRGVRSTAGSRILRDNISQQDAFAAARLFADGAVLLGKTNMHEFAFGVTNANPHFGNVHNPWHLDHMPGGSSGGSAAAVAARLCLGSLGSDTGGSIRIPAALCGVTGLKPTYGRVSLSGVFPLSWSNDHAGPIAQTAEDCAFLLNAIAGYDTADPVSVNVPAEDYVAALSRPLKGVKFAIMRGYFEQDVDPELLQAVHDVQRVLIDLGAVCVPQELASARLMYDTNRLMLRVEAATLHREWLETRSADYGSDVYERLNSFKSIRVDEYALARRHQVELQRELETLFDEISFFITPSTLIPAPRLGSDALDMAQKLTAFTAPFDVTGVPAISIPAGFTEAGLPIGVQIVGPAWGDAIVLNAAHQYQSVTDWHQHLPPLS